MSEIEDFKDAIAEKVAWDDDYGTGQLERDLDQLHEMIEQAVRLQCVVQIAAIRDAPGNGSDTYLIYSQAMDEIHPDEEP